MPNFCLKYNINLFPFASSQVYNLLFSEFKNKSTYRHLNLFKLLFSLTKFITYALETNKIFTNDSTYARLSFHLLLKFQIHFFTKIGKSLLNEDLFNKLLIFFPFYHFLFFNHKMSQTVMRSTYVCR